MFHIDQRLRTVDHRLGNYRGALLPYIGSGIGHKALWRFMIMCNHVNSVGSPVISNQTHIAMRAPDLDRRFFLSFALVSIRVQIIEADLHHRNDTLSFVLTP